MYATSSMVILIEILACEKNFRCRIQLCLAFLWQVLCWFSCRHESTSV